jgi:hypothetical protein
MLLPTGCAAISWALIGVVDRNIPVRALLFENPGGSAGVAKWAAGVLVGLGAIGAAAYLLPRLFWRMPGLPSKGKRADAGTGRVISGNRDDAYLMLGCCVALTLAFLIGLIFQVGWGFKLPAMWGTFEATTGWAWFKRCLLGWWAPNVIGLITFYLLAQSNRNDYLKAVKASGG